MKNTLNPNLYFGLLLELAVFLIFFYAAYLFCISRNMVHSKTTHSCYSVP